jgi:hypothetical protein
LLKSKGPRIKLIRTCARRARSKFATLKKPQDSEEPCGLSLRIIFRSIFDNYPLHHALLSWARVVNTYLLTSSQRGCHYFARMVNDSRSCAEREADRAFRTFDYDSFPRLVSSYGASRIRRRCGRGCLGRGCGCLLSRCRACLRKGQWGD